MFTVYGVQWLSRVQHFVIPWTVAGQTPLSMEFSRQEYWSGLLFPPLGNLPNQGIEPVSLVSPALAGRFFTSSATYKPITGYDVSVNNTGLHVFNIIKWISYCTYYFRASFFIQLDVCFFTAGCF